MMTNHEFLAEAANVYREIRLMGAKNAQRGCSASIVRCHSCGSDIARYAGVLSVVLESAGYVCWSCAD